MGTAIIDSALYAKMLACGTATLSANKKTVNDLNVFPIPDGDTGDNMCMTISSGSSALSGEDQPDLDKAAQTAASGMLLGARGNSGVILSRIFAGIARGLQGVKEAGIKEISHAMDCGVEESYNSVSNPVEGTINPHLAKLTILSKKPKLVNKQLKKINVVSINTVASLLGIDKIFL